MSKTDQLQHHNPDAHPTYLASLPTHLEPPSSLKSTTVDPLKYPIPLHGYFTRNIETPVSFDKSWDISNIDEIEKKLSILCSDIIYTKLL